MIFKKGGGMNKYELFYKNLRIVLLREEKKAEEDPSSSLVRFKRVADFARRMENSDDSKEIRFLEEINEF